MNAGKQEGDTKNHGHFLNFAYPSECMYVCGCVCFTYCGTLGMPHVEDLFLTRLLQNLVNDSRKILQS